MNDFTPPEARKAILSQLQQKAAENLAFDLYVDVCQEANACDRLAHTTSPLSPFKKAHTEVATEWARIAESLRPVRFDGMGS